jgi:hypothetical protein
MILGCALRVSGNGIANEGTGAACRNNNRGKVDREEKKRGGERERTKLYVSYLKVYQSTFSSGVNSP